MEGSYPADEATRRRQAQLQNALDTAAQASPPEEGNAQASTGPGRPLPPTANTAAVGLNGAGGDIQSTLPRRGGASPVFDRLTRLERLGSFDSTIGAESMDGAGHEGDVDVDDADNSADDELISSGEWTPRDEVEDGVEGGVGNGVGNGMGNGVEGGQGRREGAQRRTRLRRRRSGKKKSKSQRGPRRDGEYMQRRGDGGGRGGEGSMGKGHDREQYREHASSRGHQRDHSGRGGDREDGGDRGDRDGGEQRGQHDGEGEGGRRGGEEEITAGAIAQADRTPPVTALGGEEVPVVPAAVGAAAARAVGANRMTASFRLRQRTIDFLQARICSMAVLGGVG